MNERGIAPLNAARTAQRAIPTKASARVRPPGIGQPNWVAQNEFQPIFPRLILSYE